jgi:hypothetical protein
MLHKLALTSFLSAVLVAPAWADTTIIDDNFESYADDSAMQAAWVPNGTLSQPPFLFDFNTPGQPYTDITPPDPGSVDGKAVLFDGTTGGFLKSSTEFSIVPSATQNVVLKGDLAHDMQNGNKRLTIGLRYTGEATENLIEIGFYNGFTVGPNGEFFQFGHRTALMPGNTNWQAATLPDNKNQLFEIAQKGFHTFQATISTTDITFQIDLFGDGINNGTNEPGWDSTDVVAAVTSANGYNDIRFGGPSGITSASPFLGIDNISLKLVDIVGPSENADFDGNGLVDGRDFLIWQRGFGTPGAQLADGDANGDNVVDGLDLGIWKTKYGTGGLAAIATVPEPASLILFACASLAFVARRR